MNEAPLRIAVISAHTSPLSRPGGNKTGGLNVYVLELAHQLAARGCAVDIFSRLTSNDTPEVTQLAPGVRAVHLRTGPARSLSPERTYEHVDAFSDALIDFARRDGVRYDVIHSHYWLSGLAGMRLKQAWGIPHIAMFHTLGEVKNRASPSENETDLRISSEAAVIADADRVVCATDQERSLVRQLYAADDAKISVIPLGVDMERFQPTDKDVARASLGLAEGQRIVLFVGRIEPLKGVDILINAAAMLESDVDCSVLIVGGDESSTSQVASLRDLARERGIEGRVSFVGAVDHETLPLYYNAADVCVVPSHYESFGLVAVEAMASGVPVVASRVGGLTGTVRDGETGYLIPWLCPEPFAERIELLLENEPLRRNLGEAARDAVGRYRWENVATSVLDLYNALLGRSELLPTGTV
ncbi:MAG TPA: glycosyltransferase [Dehalococcoidia bacterium]|nr:glycosyltransferase [Dehalococcoidia bacterium]